MLNLQMWDGEFQKHTTCISEAEKYEKTLYKGDKKKNKQQQQQQQNDTRKPLAQPKKTTEPVSAAVVTPALATSSVPSTSAPATNGTSAYTEIHCRKLLALTQISCVYTGKLTPIDSQAIAAEVKAAPSDATPASAKKDRKRKRRSDAAKTADTDAGNTSEAQVALELLPEKAAEKGQT